MSGPTTVRPAPAPATHIVPGPGRCDRRPRPPQT